MKIHAYAATRSKAKLKPYVYTPKELGPLDVEIKVTHCGICHSDVHMLDNDWDIAEFPLVPGHEIVGFISALGSQVKNLRKGMRVGVGWQSDSCGSCEWCERGEETCCEDIEGILVGRHGGFADHVRVNSHFAIPIPDSLDSAATAPLLCGGVTVYTPLKNHARSVSRVGVIGIGGLGHMALQFARAMGCEVTAFSGDASKKKEAESFGAHHFVVTKRGQSPCGDSPRRSLDLLISAVTADLDWEKWMEVLRPKGKLVIVGASPGNISVPAMSLISGSRAVAGSMIGDPSVIREMLEFAARHLIQPKVEVVPITQVNEAMDRVRKSKARYRIVLKL